MSPNRQLPTLILSPSQHSQHSMEDEEEMVKRPEAIGAVRSNTGGSTDSSTVPGLASTSRVVRGRRPSPVNIQEGGEPYYSQAGAANNSAVDSHGPVPMPMQRQPSSRSIARRNRSARRHGRSNSDIPTSVLAPVASSIPPPHVMRHVSAVGNGTHSLPPLRYPTTTPSYGSISSLYYNPYTNEGMFSNTNPPRPRAGSFSSEHQLQQQQQQQLRNANTRIGHHRKSQSSSDPMGGAGGTDTNNFSPQAEWRNLASRIADRHHQNQNHHHGRIGSSSSYDDSIVGEAVFSRSIRPLPPLHLGIQYGTDQPLKCRNVLFLLLFVFHLILVMYTGQHYFLKAVHDKTTNHDDNDEVVIDLLDDNLIKIAAYSGIFAVTLSMLLLLIVSFCSQYIIQTALFLTISMSFLWGTIGIGISPHSAVPITGMIGFALSIAYAFIVWDRIPLSAANLRTGISALRHFWSICCIAICVQWMAWAYVVYFSFVVCGVYDWIQEQWALERGGLVVVTEVESVDNTNSGHSWKDMKMNTTIERGIYTLLAVSFYWTLQVLQGTVQAITAAIVRGWWFTPKKEGVVSEALFRTIFYSLGSICFGSLLVGPVRLLRMISILFRPSGSETSSLMVLHELVHFVQSCMASCVDRLSASINAWSYTYIGMFHYGFLDAGYKATEVFASRGWTTIVSDDLVSNVFFLTSLMIGGLTGCFAFIISSLEGLRLRPSVEKPGLATFAIGVFVGLVLPSIVFSVISSAVDAVLVCFASSPMVLEENHPELSWEMREAWLEVWPGALESTNPFHTRKRSNGRAQSASPLHASMRVPMVVYGGTNGEPTDLHPLLV